MKEYIIKVDENNKDITGGMPLLEPAKELVRCKDCSYEHERIRRDGRTGKCSLEYYCPLRNEWVNPDWYCADAVRRG